MWPTVALVSGGSPLLVQSAPRMGVTYAQSATLVTSFRMVTAGLTCALAIMVLPRSALIVQTTMLLVAHRVLKASGWLRPLRMMIPCPRC